MSIEELEAGLRVMEELGAHSLDFWDKNVAAFRQTVLLAIRDTSDALLSPDISAHWRKDLESQLPQLFQLLEFADRRIATCSSPLTPWLH